MANKKQSGLVGRAAKQQTKKYVRRAVVANPFVTVCVVLSAIGMFIVLGVVLTIVAAVHSTSTTSLPPGACSNGSDYLTSGGLVPVKLRFGGVTIGGLPLTAEQKSVALAIAGTAKGRGLSRRDAKVGLMTSIQETNLRIVLHGDKAGPDSAGPFQQRAPWGPYAVRISAIGSSKLFFNALIKIPNRDSLSLLDEAMQVQHPSLAAYTSPSHSFVSWEAPVEQMLGDTYDSTLTALPTPPISIVPTIPDNNPTATLCVPVVTNGEYGYPLGQKATAVIGCPFQGTHTLYHNWQSDNGVDLATPIGTEVDAVADGVIGPRIGSLGASASNLQGLRLTLEASGNDFYYQHLVQLLVVAGQHVKRGDPLGYSGISGVAHLHFAMHSEFNPARAIGLAPTLCPDSNWSWPSWLAHDIKADDGTPLKSS